MSRAPNSGAPKPRKPVSRAPLWRAVVALCVVALSLYVALTQTARLGLDLRGGTHIVLETKDSPTVTADAASTDRALEVLRQRVDALGVAEPGIARSGEKRIIVELPGVQDPRKAAEVIGRTAQLTVHPVTGERPEPGGKKPAADGSRTLPDPDRPGNHLVLGPTVLSGAGVKDAEARLTSSPWQAGPSRSTSATKPATRGRASPARRRAHRREHPSGASPSPIDDKIISAPGVNPDVRCGIGITGGETQITGGFGQTEARDLAALVKGGALPVPVDIVEQRTVGPTLGADAIAASTEAALIGIALTALFITVVYRLLGALAALALALYGLISYAALIALGATLTLPGLAGFVLAIGMAVDANVLVFERAREEYLGRPGGRSTDLVKPVRTGFAKA